MTTQNKENTDGAAAPVADPARQAGLPAARYWVVRGNDRRHRETTLREDATAVLHREKSIGTREDAADTREKAAGLRENAAHAREDEAQLREGAVTAREQEIRGKKTLLAADENHLVRMQQANASLVIATIESHNLVDQIRLANSQIDHLAHHDCLTDLPNRLLLLDRFKQAIELARRQGGLLAVMFLDLDHFKYINDSLGHGIGDQLLQSVAHRLSTVVRSTDTICRQGGDEFVILLTDVEHAEDAALSAQKIIDTLAMSHRIEHFELRVTASIGISIYPDDGADAETLIQNADNAMYQAKEYGRNHFQFFEERMNAQAVERHTIESGLRGALERQEFVLHYQPKINLATGAISGIEALIRWQHPQRGMILPEQFIRIAEECGLIVSIGAWVLREACRHAQSWQDAGLLPVPVSVNISAVQIRKKTFLESLAGILQETGLAPACLELELTESVLMQDVEATTSVLKALKVMGVRLTIDDFGTGYSSLSYLKRFPIDTLKIDQSFMQGITHANANSDDAAIVSAVVGMGKSLKQCVIAEGVETRAQMAFLQAQGCSEGQGLYFSEPVAADKVVALLRSGIANHLLV